jgi:hypothetical protein
MAAMPPGAPPPGAARPGLDSGHLLSLCSGLGAVRELAGGGCAYVRDAEALDCLLDIQRFLRRDDPATRHVVCQLADWNTLRGHVVPLMCTYAANFDLLFNATKVRAPAPGACLCLLARGSAAGAARARMRLRAPRRARVGRAQRHRAAARRAPRAARRSSGALGRAAFFGGNARAFPPRRAAHRPPPRRWPSS